MRILFFLSLSLCMLCACDALHANMLRDRLDGIDGVKFFISRNRVCRLLSTDGRHIEVRIIGFNPASQEVQVQIVATAENVRFPISLLEEASAQTVLDWHIKEGLYRRAYIETEMKEPTRRKEELFLPWRGTFKVPKVPKRTVKLTSSETLTSENHRMIIRVRNGADAHIKDVVVLSNFETLRRISDSGRTLAPKDSVGSHYGYSNLNQLRDLPAGATAEMETAEKTLVSYFCRFREDGANSTAVGSISVDERVGNRYVVLIYKGEPIVGWILNDKDRTKMSEQVMEHCLLGQNSIMQTLIDEDRDSR